MRKYFILMFLAVPLYADCGVADVLLKIRPGAVWTLHKDGTLEWLDLIQKKPSVVEIDQAISDCSNDRDKRSTDKILAKIIFKDKNRTVKERLDALELILDLDR